MVQDASPTMRVLFGVVAGLSVVGNMLLCIVMIRRRAMLGKTYNILIFNLAVADMLTGILSYHSVSIFTLACYLNPRFFRVLILH